MKNTRPGAIAGYALRHLFKKSETELYKTEHDRTGNDARIRGKLIYDKSTCIGCKICCRDCPAGAIFIENLGTKEDKNFQATVDLSSCIFCCQCVDSCPKDCLSFSCNTDLAAFGRDDLKVILTNEQ